MQILILEDSFEQRNNLFKFISTSYEDVKVHLAGDISEGMEILKYNNIDLFFIDINLPDGCGCEFAKGIRGYEGYELTPIVFITTETSKVMEGVQGAHCYNYLIKPYLNEDIKKVIDTFNKKALLDMGDKFVVIKLDKTLSTRIRTDDIIFIEYSYRELSIYTKEQCFKSKVLTLGKLIDKLECNNFVQTHKSYVVNINHIKDIKRIYQRAWHIRFTLIDNVAQLSNTYRSEIFNRWEE